MCTSVNHVVCHGIPGDKALVRLATGELIDATAVNAKEKGGKDEADEEPLERLEYASKKDHQFQQALNLLKGLKIMQNKAQ